MILSVSRRTDIPSFYGEWFLRRLRAGFVYVRNPFNVHMVQKIILNPKVIDCMVFWTKDARPFMKFLPKIDKLGCRYYFQYTITPYDNHIEPNVLDKEEIINNFIMLSKKLGKERVIWRYDPILLTDKVDVNFHIKNFERMCKVLAPFTTTVIISFLDMYKKIKNTDLRSPTLEEMKYIAKNFKEIARKYNISIKTCAEPNIFKGILKGACIDKNLIEKICGYKIKAIKDKFQRKECRCIESIDIGEYNTCPYLCKYCYANNNIKNIKGKILTHDVNSPFLMGNILPLDKIYIREVKSLKIKK